VKQTSESKQPNASCLRNKSNFWATEKGVSTDPAKVDQVVNWPTPTNKRQLQQFFGLAGYYRRFVKDFAALGRPLHRLLEKSSGFKWTEECQQAFELTQETHISTNPHFSRPLSDVCIGYRRQ
jgi:hypothetical protein